MRVVNLELVALRAIQKFITPSANDTSCFTAVFHLFVPSHQMFARANVVIHLRANSAISAVEQDSGNTKE